MRRIAVWLGIVGLATGCGDVGLHLPSQFPVSDYHSMKDFDYKQPEDPLNIPADVHLTIGQILDEQFGTPEDPGMSAAYMTDEEYQRILPGSKLYHKHCIHCHGLTGNGNGPTAPFLFPRPRDYRAGVFKWKSTEYTAKPTGEDIKNIIRHGAPGSSMPPFKLLPEVEIEQLAEYVKFLSKRGEVERKLFLAYATEEEVPSGEALHDLFVETVESWRSADDALIEPGSTRPPWEPGSAEYEQSLARGKALFMGKEGACYTCHGPDARADKADIAQAELNKMFDDWGRPNFPRNLKLGLYRGGRRPIDLYRRIHAGIRGAAMPGQSTTLKPEQIWDLVNFVRALPYRDLLPREQPRVDGHHASLGH